jgi:hypothetical protein
LSNYQPDRYYEECVMATAIPNSTDCIDRVG